MKHMKRTAGFLAAVTGLAACAVFGQGAETEGVASARWTKPISNPIYHDTALLKREVNVFYMYHTFPSHIDIGGANVKFDGYLNAVAVQMELPLTEDLAFLANRTGYIDFNPETNLLNAEDGFADIGAGLKWEFWQNERMTLALRASVELPTGDDEVFQQAGDGRINPALVATLAKDAMALNGTVGVIMPFDSSENSTMGYMSVGYAQRISDRVSAHLEVNWFRVLEAGHGEADFNNQGGTLLPGALEFEGGDLINFGAANSETQRDFVSFAVGGRYQFSDAVSVGAAYEFPLTDKENGIMDSRITASLSYSF